MIILLGFLFFVILAGLILFFCGRTLLDLINKDIEFDLDSEIEDQLDESARDDFRAIVELYKSDRAQQRIALLDMLEGNRIILGGVEYDVRGGRMVRAGRIRGSRSLELD